jgi:tetratricopeptide (TPR) repeat protein
MQEGGTDAAVALYRKLKTEGGDDYAFHDADLLVIGDKLLEKGRAGAAVAMLELGLAEYPDSPYAYYASYKLALAQERLGDREAALRSCRRAAELAPDNARVRALLERLEGS